MRVILLVTQASGHGPIEPSRKKNNYNYIFYELHVEHRFSALSFPNPSLLAYTK